MLSHRSLITFCLPCLPTLCVLTSIVVGSAVRIQGYSLLPTLYLIPVYYWLLFRPTWLPIGSLLGIGCFYDALLGHELGFSSAILLASAFVLPYAYSFLPTTGFVLMWALFGLYSLVCLMIYGLYDTPFLPLSVSWIYGMLLYPLATWGLSHLYLRLRPYV